MLLRLGPTRCVRPRAAQCLRAELALRRLTSNALSERTKPRRTPSQAKSETETTAWGKLPAPMPADGHGRAISEPPAPVRKKRVSRKKDKTVIAWGELPTSLLSPDGEIIKPLAEFKEVTARSTKKKAAAEDDEERDYQEAVRRGSIPETPLAKLVWQNWRRFPDCVLLTQVGNFYESYFEPAIRVSSLLGIKLTSKTYRSGTFPFTGFPIHQRDKYLKMLVHDLGFTVVLVEEEKDVLKLKDTEDINRRVARIVTPGTLLEETWLTGNESRYLLAISLGETETEPIKKKQDVEEETEASPPVPLFLAYADVSTGEFFTKQGTSAEIEDELARIAPREIVLDSRLRDEWTVSDTNSIASSPSGHLFSLLRVLGVHVSFQEVPEVVALPRTKKRGAPVSPSALEREAIGLLRHHLEYALRDSMPEIPDEFNRESASHQMHIDAATLQALEIRSAFRPGGLLPTSSSAAPASPLTLKGTLLSTLSRTVTDSGHRLLKRTLSAPSTDLAQINARLALVAAFVEREPLRTDLRDALRSIADVMRIVQRFRSHSGEGHDVWAVARWIRDVEKLLDIVRVSTGLERKPRRQTPTEQVEGADRLTALVSAFSPLSRLADDIENAIDEVGVQGAPVSDEEDPEGILAAGDAMVASKKAAGDAMVASKKETTREAEERKREEAERQRWWIKPSFSTELTDLYDLITELNAGRAEMQARLQEEFGASTLQLGTNLRGAFIVTVKRKTQLGALERSGKFHAVSETKSSKAFAYSEWSALGAKIEKAYAELAVAQARALRRLRTMVIEHADTIQTNAELVDEIDLTAGFAQAAVDLNLTRPTLHEGTELEIINGRHPAVEAGLLSSSRVFTPNSTHLTPTSQLHVITGPNQGGKSTLLRQTAIIAILAQSGSFVPADSARLGIVDRVFSRVGARDDLFRDRSTFMLEMVETAAILKYATPRSLVIMDEIGRGTTLDAGVSIAYATLDYILREIGCRTLFATHYHELAGMLGAPPQVSRESTSSVTPIPPDCATLRPGVAFFCTDVDEMGTRFAYSYRLRPGVNYDSHAIKAAQLAGMPASFLETAERTLKERNEG